MLEETSNIETGLRLPHRTTERKEKSTEKTPNVTLLLKSLKSIISDEKCTDLTKGQSLKSAKIEEKIGNYLTGDEKDKLTATSLRSSIRSACGGLIYISETDSDIKPVFVSNRDAASLEEAVVQLAGPSQAKPDEMSAEDFFTRLTKERAWHSERDKENVRRFRILRDRLFENLTDLRQYRLGKTRIHIFVIGYDKNKNIAGISTEAVET